MQVVALSVMDWTAHVWLVIGQLVELPGRHTLSCRDTQPPTGAVEGCVTFTVALVWVVAFTTNVGALRTGTTAAAAMGRVHGEQTGW